jgi:hypothetical protein
MATSSFFRNCIVILFLRWSYAEREREETSNRDRPSEVTTRECMVKFHGRANGMVLRRSWAPKRPMPICLAACRTRRPRRSTPFFSANAQCRLAPARARGRLGGRKRKLSPQQARVVKDPLGQSIRSRLSHSSLAFPKTLLIASCDRSVLARQSQ